MKEHHSSPWFLFMGFDFPYMDAFSIVCVGLNSQLVATLLQCIIVLLVGSHLLTSSSLYWKRFIIFTWHSISALVLSLYGFCLTACQAIEVISLCFNYWRSWKHHVASLYKSCMSDRLNILKILSNFCDRISRKTSFA